VILLVPPASEKRKLKVWVMPEPELGVTETAVGARSLPIWIILPIEGTPLALRRKRR